MSSIINNFFDKVYVINLKSRQDRLKECKAELDKHGIDYTVFDAIKGDGPAGKIRLPGLVGCLLSHVEILKQAKSMNLGNVFIFEDDIILDPNFNNKLSLVMQELPSDWDMFYLGGNNVKPEINLKKVTDNIYKTSHTLTTHAYAIKNNLFEKVIKEQLMFENPPDGYYASKIHPNYNCYVVKPGIAFQRPSFSDIQKGFRDYTKIIK